MMKKTLGKLPGDAFGVLDLPPLPQAVLDGYRGLHDLTGTVSDAMDELGIVGVAPAALFQPVAICGIVVNPGDLVLADETGVCFIPHARAAEVLQRAQRNATAEKLREEKIVSGAPVSELFGKTR